MNGQFYSKENLKFLLHEVFPVAELCQRDYFKEHTPESFDMMLEAADSLAATHLRPILEEMDRNPPTLEGDRIKVHPHIHKLMKKFGEDGWISMSAPHQLGGMQVPFTVMQSVAFIMAAANYSTMVFPFLSTGAAHLIETFGSKELQEKYIPNMFSGAW